MQAAKWLSIALVASMTFGCAGSVEEPGPCDLDFDLLQHLSVVEVRHPTPVLRGTQFVVRGEGFIPVNSCVALVVALVGRVGSEESEREIRLEVSSVASNEITAVLSAEALGDIGAGDFTGAMVTRFHAVDGPEVFESRFDISFSLADTVTPSISSAQDGEVYLNDLLSLSGEGFLTGDEGTTEINIEGTFTGDLGDTTSVAVRIPAELVEAQDRTRAAFLWSPRIGGLQPGTFEGNVTPENVLPSGGRASGASVHISTRQQRTVLFGVAPETVALGQIAQFQGRGFVGAAPDATTFIRLEGIFTPHGGEPEDATFELFGAWMDGGRLDYTVVLSTAGDYLHSEDFGTHRGRFEGTAVPVLTMGGSPVEGIETDVSFTLGPVRQIVWVRYLAGFRDSLELFGLGALEDVLSERIVQRMQEIYCPPDLPRRCVNVQFVAEQPEDFYDGGYAVIDIGGADPNGMGLFGYDNTGTKDVGNLRLADHVGGENALGALDGYAYGGIFVDSILYWSADPPFDDRPEYAPNPDPRFDAIFDPLRQQEVVAGEYPDGATGERLAAIEAAASFFVHVVADIGAHEFGHTLGLAQPREPEGGIHNAESGEGCLMDSGTDRPLEERALLDGNTGTRFCGENIEYLLEILPSS